MLLQTGCVQGWWGCGCLGRALSGPHVALSACGRSRVSVVGSLETRSGHAAARGQPREGERGPFGVWGGPVALSACGHAGCPFRAARAFSACGVAVGGRAWPFRHMAARG